jgi:hypothetical protein
LKGELDEEISQSVKNDQGSGLEVPLKAEDSAKNGSDFEEDVQEEVESIMESKGSISKSN